MERLKVFIVGCLGFLGIEVSSILPLAEITPVFMQVPEMSESNVRNVIQIIIGIITIIQLLKKKKPKPADDNE